MTHVRRGWNLAALQILELRSMSQDIQVDRFFESLVNGNRDSARATVTAALTRCDSARTVINDLLWPSHEMIEKLHRSDQIDQMAYHLSTRLLRVMVDQVAARLEIPANRTRTIFAVCGPSQSEELGAQMAVDLLESSGFHVTFSGGGVPGDEIIAQVQDRQPDVLLMFASAASDLPDIRMVIDRLKEVGACESTRIVVGGGVFNRAEGLAEEIGADLSASSPMDLVELLTQETLRPAMGARQTTARSTATATRRRKAA